MTDSFKDEIRNRMVEVKIEYQLPLELFVPSKGGAELLVKHLRPVLYEMIGRTARSGREHSTAAFADMGGSVLDVVELQEGTEASVGSVTPPSHSEISFDIHSHPIPGSLGFSTADVRAMLGDLFQYPDDVRKELQQGTISKHFGVVTQRLGEDDNGLASTKIVTVDESVLELSIAEQRDITQEAINEFQNTDFLPLEERLGPAGDFITTQRLQFEIPKKGQSLKFKSAIPNRVGDRAFGNAFSDGDLTEVLQGVEYI